jgi:hypothetical protein
MGKGGGLSRRLLLADLVRRRLGKASIVDMELDMELDMDGSSATVRLIVVGFRG